MSSTQRPRALLPVCPSSSTTHRAYRSWSCARKRAARAPTIGSRSSSSTTSSSCGPAKTRRTACRRSRRSRAISSRWPASSTSSSSVSHSSPAPPAIPASSRSSRPFAKVAVWSRTPTSSSCSGGTKRTRRPAPRASSMAASRRTATARRARSLYCSRPNKRASSARRRIRTCRYDARSRAHWSQPAAGAARGRGTPHRRILGAIERVWERGEPLGFQTVQAELAARGELDNIGGAQFLVGLMQNVPTVAHAETYATIVERTALLRRLIGAANEIAHLALTREDAKSAVVDAQELLFAVSESNLHRDVVPLEIALRRFADQITQRADDQHVGVPTGFTSLDAKTGGLQPSDLILLAGRPGLGKTSFALNIVWQAAAVERKTCAVFSLE